MNQLGQIGAVDPSAGLTIRGSSTVRGYVSSSPCRESGIQNRGQPPDSVRDPLRQETTITRLLRPASVAALLWLVVALNVVAGYYPFRLEPPPFVANQAARLEDGTLRLVESSFVRTAEPPEWLGAAAAASEIAIDLEVRPALAEAERQPRILAISRDTSTASLTVAQGRDNLVVRLRRPGADLRGDPPFRVNGIFADRQWQRIQITVGDERLEIAVDGTVRVSEPLGPQPLASWDAGHHLALGDEVTRGRAWLGDIRRAVVHTPAGSVDYLAPGELEAPAQIWRDPERPGRLVRGMLRVIPTNFEDDLWHIVGGLPLGFLLVALRRPARPVLAAAAAGALLGLVVEVGQLPIEGRTSELVDILLQTLGAALGGAAGSRFLRRRRGAPSPPEISATAAR